eukprot:3946582-Prymnesium_polylepis.1
MHNQSRGSQNSCGAESKSCCAFHWCLRLLLTQQLFEDVPHPPHATNKSWFTYRPHNVAHHAHLRVHAVALLIDRDWHDQICEQGAAARLWFEYVGRACAHWHTVLKEPISEAVVLQAREVMRIIEDSWHNLDNMRGGRRDPAAEAFGERWESAGGHSAHDGAVLKIPEDGGIAFSHPSGQSCSASCGAPSCTHMSLRRSGIMSCARPQATQKQLNTPMPAKRVLK